MTARLRPARPGEAATLTALALASKAHWGYDRAFLDACRDVLTVTDRDLGRIVVGETDRPVGWYGLVTDPPRGELTDLWVHPSAIGTGVGRTLWTHAVRSARAGGVRCLHLESDPHAEGFYLAMGARWIGSVPSGLFPGRSLPLMELDVQED